jgi:nucleoside-diphosphate-sugar epimerase
MKIVVIGGSGLIGSKTVERLRKKGHGVTELGRQHHHR